MAVTRDDPYLAHNFLIRIDNTVLGGFSEVTGLTQDTELIAWRVGTDFEPHVRQLIGLRKYNPIVLKRGYATSRALWQWRLNILNGVNDLRSGSILLLNETRKRVVEYHFADAWPSKYEGAALNAKGNEVAIETVELIPRSWKIVA
jgi:phage tail-like protein